MRQLSSLLAAFLLSAGCLHAQGTTGTVTGRVIDARTGEPLPSVIIQIEGTRIGTMSEESGRYTVNGIPAGKVTIIARRLGFGTKSITGVTVVADDSTAQNITMDPAAAAMKAQVVTASAERGSVAASLDIQRNAPNITNAITAEQISKSPDGDAAAAVARVSGVTVQDGKYVFVRGLGERYTTASLNGARLPSPEPEKRVVPLDIFPSALLQSVTTSKTFTPDQPGDFSGASVDIRTREYSARRFISYSISAGYNGSAAGHALPSAPRLGSEWLAYAGSQRSTPSAIVNREDLTTASQTKINQTIRAFNNHWLPVSQNRIPGYSGNVALGGKAPLGPLSVGYIASGSYGYDTDARSNFVIAQTAPDGTGQLRPSNAFSGTSSTGSVLWGGLLNLNSLIGSGTQIVLNNTYNRTADNTAREELGIRDGNIGPTRRTVLNFVSRGLRANQLRVNHPFGDRHHIDLSVTSSGVSRNEPDRTEVQYIREVDPVTNQLLPYTIDISSLEGARKAYSDLRENALNTTIGYQRGFLKIGGAYRYTHRNSSVVVYSINSGHPLPPAALQQSPEALFHSAYTAGDSAVFSLSLNSDGGTYKASDHVSAMYAMADAQVTERLKLVAGARVEYDRLMITSVSANSPIDISVHDDIDVLPSIAATYALTRTQNLRFSVTQTLARPEYREISAIGGRDWISERNIRGNPNLQRSLIQNVDTRWEWYPRDGEIISLGAFAKHFVKPIEQIEVATSGAEDLGYTNATGATNYGVEGEFRAGLDRIAQRFASFAAFANVTLMRSRIDLGNNTQSALTNTERPMVGQSPYVVNAGLAYSRPNQGPSATILYNVAGKRIRAAGVNPRPDTYELPRPALDISLEVPVTTRIAVKTNAKNLLDSEYQERQGTVTRLGYKTGRAFSLGVRWR